VTKWLGPTISRPMAKLTATTRTTTTRTTIRGRRRAR
jgi:hypothetical protein